MPKTGYVPTSAGTRRVFSFVLRSTRAKCTSAFLGVETTVGDLKREGLGILDYGRLTEKVSVYLQKGLDPVVREQRRESVAGGVRPFR